MHAALGRCSFHSASLVTEAVTEEIRTASNSSLRRSEQPQHSVNCHCTRGCVPAPCPAPLLLPAPPCGCPAFWPGPGAGWRAADAGPPCWLDHGPCSQWTGQVGAGCLTGGTRVAASGRASGQLEHPASSNPPVQQVCLAVHQRHDLAGQAAASNSASVARSAPSRTVSTQPPTSLPPTHNLSASTQRRRRAPTSRTCSRWPWHGTWQPAAPPGGRPGWSRQQPPALRAPPPAPAPAASRVWPPPRCARLPAARCEALPGRPWQRRRAPPAPAALPPP